MITKINAEMISALSVQLTPIKTLNRVHECLVRSELQHDVIKRPGHCITATT